MESPETNPLFTRQAIEITIKIVALLGILAWCFRLLEPFIVPVVWACIIAVALNPVCDWFQEKLGGNRKWASVIVTLLMLSILITPTTILVSKTFESFQYVTDKIDNDELQVDPPAQRVREWPLIGDATFKIWNEASINLDKTLQKYEPQIQEQARKVLKSAASFGMAILLFALSIIISGFLMVGRDTGKKSLVKFARRLAGDEGERFVNLSGVTIRNVTRGILGVAFIQAVFAALGLYVMGIPGAPILAFGVLMLGIVQISPGLILIPVSIYTYSIASPTVATIFLIWNIIVGSSDNVLKPLLMGAGTTVPTLVIFLGAIGGFIASGLVGLFVGAVVVVLGYEVFLSWLHADESEEPSELEDSST
jgi:predicted PurR-regulated permease PerM